MNNNDDASSMMSQDNINTTAKVKATKSLKRKSSTRRSTDLVPKDMDVVCGRGCASVNRPGNKRFTAIVQTGLEEYEKALTRVDKTMVVAKVLDEVLQNGARFLKKAKGKGDGFVEMTREEAHSMSEETKQSRTAIF